MYQNIVSLPTAPYCAVFFDALQQHQVLFQIQNCACFPHSLRLCEQSHWDVCCESLPSLAQARGQGGFAPYGSIFAGASQFDVAAQPNLRFHFLGVVVCIVVHRQHRGVVVCVDVCIVVCVVVSVVVVCVVTRCLRCEVAIFVVALLFALRRHCCGVAHRLRRGVVICVAALLSASWCCALLCCPLSELRRRCLRLRCQSSALRRRRLRRRRRQ